MRWIIFDFAHRALTGCNRDINQALKTDKEANDENH